MSTRRKPIKVKGTLRLDTGYEVEVADCSAFFAQATDAEIEGICVSEFQDSSETDAVALFLDSDPYPEVMRAFEYMRMAEEFDNKTENYGYSFSVEPYSLLEWLKRRKPSLAEKLLEDGYFDDQGATI